MDRWGLGGGSRRFVRPLHFVNPPVSGDGIVYRLTWDDEGEGNVGGGLSGAGEEGRRLGKTIRLSVAPNIVLFGPCTSSIPPCHGTAFHLFVLGRNPNTIRQAGRGGGRGPLGPSSRDEVARGLGEGRGGARAGTKQAG